MRPALFLHRSGGMKHFLQNRFIRVGLVLMGVGWTPLWSIVLLTKLGLWPDPNPNPVGPGILFFLTSWPAIISLAIGMVQVWRGRARSDGSPRSPSSGGFRSTQPLYSADAADRFRRER
jgi:hypothetical protein